MDISYLKEFVYLANSLSFKRTAEHFYVSRSVISRHLVAIEETIGAKLVDRGGSGVSLTPIGEVFYRDALVLLRDYASALEHVRDAQASRARIVRIGYLRNAARPVIVQFVRFMNEHHPDIHLSMTCMEYGELRRSMDEGGVDVALAVNVHPDISRNYRSTGVYSDSFYVVMGKDNPKATRESVSLSEIPPEKLLLPDSMVYAGLETIFDSLVEEKTQLIARAYYGDMDMLYLKVITEGYVVLVSGLNSGMFGDGVVVLPIRNQDTTFKVSAFYRDELDPVLFAACREGFEACRDAMRDWETHREDFSATVKLGA